MPLTDLTIHDEQFGEVIDRHERWLNGDADGERAVLNRVEVSHQCLSSRDLSYAILRHCFISFTDFDACRLRNTDLAGSYLIRMNLDDTDLAGCDLSSTTIKHIVLSRSDLLDINRGNALVEDIIVRDIDIRDHDWHWLYPACRDPSIVGDPSWKTSITLMPASQ